MRPISSSAMREVSSSIRVSRDSGTAARSVVTRRQCLAPSAGGGGGGAPPRLLVPASGLQALAGLVEMVSEEGRARRGRGSVDREQGSRDGGVRSATAFLQLGAVGDLLRQGVPEGQLTR